MTETILVNLLAHITPIDLLALLVISLWLPLFAGLKRIFKRKGDCCKDDGQKHKQETR